MAYTNNNGQARVGVRIVPLSVVIPTISALLDSYSGAAAAYSLRKLSATWSGSAIRVRRSSDNTEMNIGFDSDGNLDTIALSSFVGSGSGFVTTWYDQTGNNFNRTQTTAAGQPNIVYLGAINMVNGKPAMYFDPNVGFALQGPKIGETYMGAGYSSTVLNVTKLDSSYSTTEEYPLFGGTGWYDSRFSINSNKWYLINTGTGISSTVNASANQVVSSVVFAYTTDKVRINGTEVISGNVGISGGTNYNYIGQSWLGKRYKGYFQEHIIYASDKTSVISAMETNMNTYYSAYPNPTSVWNLLNSVYNADTTASPSLKTSLVASYNGEANANDSFGTNNGTAVGGLTYTTGKIGNAFSFNGTNAYVSLPNNSFNNLTGDFSVSFWMNLNNSHPTDFGMLFSNLQFPVDYSTYYGFQIGFYNGQIYFTVGSNTGNSTASTRLLSSTLSGYIGTWVHVTCTHKQSTGYKIYVNGSLNTSNNGTYNPVYTTNHTPSIGAQYSVNNSPNNLTYKINGSVDALNIWQKELTASEVIELYNSGNGAQYIGDNFYKPTTNDALGTNNGTAQGGLTYGLGKVGTAFQFNGTNAYVSLPNSSGQFNFTSDFSIGCWFKTNTISGNQMIFSNLMYNGGTRKGYYIILASNTIGCWLVNQPTHNQEFYTSAVVSINTWYHLSVTRESGVVKIYLNGTLLATDTNAIPLAYVTTLTSIGAYTNATGSTLAYFNGNIDAFNIWQKALTQSEITELYNSGNGKQYPN